MRISDWSSDVCSSDLARAAGPMIALLVGARHAGDDLGRMPRRSRPAIAARITRLDRRARARLVEIIERRALERRVEAGLNRERAAGAAGDMPPKSLAGRPEGDRLKSQHEWGTRKTST